MSNHFKTATVRIVATFFVAGALFIVSTVFGNTTAAYAAAPTATPEPGKGVIVDTVKPGEQKIGEITTTDGEYRYEITGKGGDQVFTGLTGADGFSPALEIRVGGADTRGSTLGRAAPDPQTTGSLLLNYVLFKDGIYTLVVTPGLSKGNKTGRFALTFGLTTFKKPVNGIATGDVLPTNGFPILGEIKFNISQVLYKIAAKAGDKLLITMTGYFGLLPALAVRAGDYNDTSERLVTSEGKPGSSNPIIGLEFQVPTDGPYIIIASHADFETGKTSGPFIIALTVNGASVQDSLQPANAFEEPVQMPDTIEINGDAATVIGKLQDLAVVPAGGEQAASLLANVYSKASTPGLKGSPLAPDNVVSARNFVMNIQVNWTQAGADSACGISFWNVGATEFAGVLLFNSGQVNLFQNAASQSPIDYFEKSSLFTPGQVNTITLLVFGNSVSLYINGKFLTTQIGKSKYGQIVALLYNSQQNTALTFCTYPTGWIWRY